MFYYLYFTKLKIEVPIDTTGRTDIADSAARTSSATPTRFPDGRPSRTKLVRLESDTSSTSWIIACDVIIKYVRWSSSPPYDAKRVATSRTAKIVSTGCVSWITVRFAEYQCFMERVSQPFTVYHTSGAGRAELTFLRAPRLVMTMVPYNL